MHRLVPISLSLSRGSAFVPSVGVVLSTVVVFHAVVSLPLAAESIPLGSIPERVRAANPDLAAAWFRIGEARGRFAGAGRLSNPEAGLEVLPNVRGSEYTVGLSFEQRFPLTARLRLEKSVSAAELAQAEDEVRDIERRTIAAAEEVAIRWLAITMQRDLRMSQAAIAAEQTDFLEKRVAVGEGSPLDVGQARAESGRLAHEARRLGAERHALDGELRRLLGIDADESVAVVGGLEPPASHAGGRATDSAAEGFDPSRRPDLRALHHEQRASDESVELERARRWDDIAVEAFVEVERAEDAPEGLETDRFVGLGVRIPLPWWNRNEGAVEEARARAARVRAESAALAASIRNDVATARAEMDAQARLLAESSDPLIRLGEEQVGRVEEAHAAGQAPLTDVLRARDQLLEARSARIEALRDYHLARVRFESATARHAQAATPASPSADSLPK